MTDKRKKKKKKKKPSGVVLMEFTTYGTEVRDQMQAGKKKNYD